MVAYAPPPDGRQRLTVVGDRRPRALRLRENRPRGQVRGSRAPHLQSLIDILLLCTANQCRSPIAEALLRSRLRQARVTATVSSAGIYPGGRPATAHGIAAMADRGLDLSPHRSRKLDAKLVQGADLIIGMAREHVREAAVIEPEAVARSFTLKELVRAGETHGARGHDEPLDDWLVHIGAGRRREDLLGVGYDEVFDIADPVGRGRADYEATADELDQLLTRLVELVWPA